MDSQALLHAMEYAAAEWGVPGIAAAVVKGGEVVFAGGCGVRCLGEPEPVDEHSVFAIASCSKAFTAAILAVLAEQNRLRLDDRAIDHLPGFQLFDPYVTREITVRDLLCHRSGLKTFAGDLVWFGTQHSQDEVLRRARFIRPSHSFRSQYGYQNMMFVAAGMVAETVSGKSWSQLVQEYFLDPLGMADSTTSVTHLIGKRNVAQPHVERHGQVKPIEYFNLDNELPAGGINSSVADMAQWIRMQLSLGKHGDLQLISPAMIQEMWTPHTLIPIDAQLKQIFPTMHFRAYGLGWFLSDFHGRKLIDHGGGLPGMISNVTLVPEEDLGIVVLTNSETAAASALRGVILDMALGLPIRDWHAEVHAIKNAEVEAKQAYQRKLEDERVADAQPSLALQGYTGTFSCDLYGDAEVSCGQSGLILQLVPSPALLADLEHWHYDTFRLTWRDDYLPEGLVTFTLDAHGVVQEMKIDVPNRDFDFTELEFKRSA